MPSRIRILVVISTEKGIECAVGNRAILLLDKYRHRVYGSSSVWDYVDYHDVSIKLGDPLSIQPAPKQVPCPNMPELPPYQQAKWLYDQLPVNHRKAVSLVVTREPRKYDFMFSPTNPRIQFGISNPRSPKQKLFNWGTSPQETDYLADLHGNITLQTPKKRRHPYIPPKKVQAVPDDPKPTLRLGIWS